MGLGWQDGAGDQDLFGPVSNDPYSAGEGDNRRRGLSTYGGAAAHYSTPGDPSTYVRSSAEDAAAQYRNQAFQSGNREAPQLQYGDANRSLNQATDQIGSAGRDFNTGSAAISGGNFNRMQADQARGDQVGALGLQRDAAMGNAPSRAEILGRGMIDQSLKAQMAGAAGARGGPLAQMSAQRNVAQNAAGFQAHGANQLSALRADEMERARNAYQQGATGLRASDYAGADQATRMGMAYGDIGSRRVGAGTAQAGIGATQAGMANAQGQMEMAQRGLNQQGSQYYEGLAHDVREGEANRGVQLSQQENDRWAKQAQMNQGSRQNEAKATAGIIGSVGSVLGFLSDERTKKPAPLLLGGAKPKAAAPNWLERYMDADKAQSATDADRQDHESRLKADREYMMGRPDAPQPSGEPPAWLQEHMAKDELALMGGREDPYTRGTPGGIQREDPYGSGEVYFGSSPKEDPNGAPGTSDWLKYGEPAKQEETPEPEKNKTAAAFGAALSGFSKGYNSDEKTKEARDIGDVGQDEGYTHRSMQTEIDRVLADKQRERQDAKRSENMERTFRGSAKTRADFEAEKAAKQAAMMREADAQMAGMQASLRRGASVTRDEGDLDNEPSNAPAPWLAEYMEKQEPAKLAYHSDDKTKLAAAWQQGHEAATEDARKLAGKSPAELKGYDTPMAEVMRDARANAWDEGHKAPPEGRQMKTFQRRDPKKELAAMEANADADRGMVNLGKAFLPGMSMAIPGRALASMALSADAGRARDEADAAHPVKTPRDLEREERAQAEMRAAEVERATKKEPPKAAPAAAAKSSLFPEPSPVEREAPRRTFGEDRPKSPYPMMYGSDEDTKGGRSAPPSDVQADANRRMASSTWAYRDEFTPQGEKPGELHYGPMAQSLEKNPLTATAVKKDPKSGLLQVDMAKMQQAQAGGIASLQHQIDELKGGRRGR